MESDYDDMPELEGIPDNFSEDCEERSPRGRSPITAAGLSIAMCRPRAPWEGQEPIQEMYYVEDGLSESEDEDLGYGRDVRSET
jgi:hypothetical protein